MNKNLDNYNKLVFNNDLVEYYKIFEKLIKNSSNNSENYKNVIHSLIDESAKSIIIINNQYSTSPLDKKLGYDSIINEFNFNILILEKFLTVEMNHETDYKDNLGHKVMDTWNSLINHRVLYFEHGKISVKTKEGIKYSLSDLSSGEKAVLHYLISILLLPKQEYYIIDEPEANLNTSIAIELWDIIEENRNESLFMYVTHDEKFLQSRLNSNLVWIKSFDGEDWDYEYLENPEFLPHDLLISLYGNEKPVLFCEGVVNGLDHSVYKQLYPDYNVVPVGGHTSVINLTKSFTDKNTVVKYFGIIDNDNQNKEKNKNLPENIWVLPYCEIEMLLIDDILLDYYLTHQMLENEEKNKKIKTFKKHVFKLMENKSNFIIKEIFTSKLNHILTTFDFSSLDYHELSLNLNKTLNEFLTSDYLKNIETIINSIVLDKNYNLFLEYCSLKKAIVPGATKIIDTNYDNKIKNLLKIDSDAKKQITDKILVYNNNRINDQK